MNTRHENNNELMKDLLDPRMIEKAPSGFTGKVMKLVSLEARPVKTGEKPLSGIKVPIISIAVILILAGTALLLPPASNDFTAMPWMKIVKTFGLQAVNINMDRLVSFSVPGYLPYLFIAILFLTIVDRGLSGLFHRGK